MGPQAAPPKAPKTDKRDELQHIQATIQVQWRDEHIFEAQAPPAGGPQAPKFFGTFPYPYMNGVLHLGHAFSLSKLEFASAYHRLCGRNVLFPQGFHCTGMPIKACADRLAREMRDGVTEGGAAEAEQSVPPAAAGDPPPPEPGAADKRHSGKKSKAAAKQGTAKTQWQILADSGIPQEDIPKFQDAQHWLEHFPPQAQHDIALMGCGVDWRRSFITTDANPCYDAFVQWQMRKLHGAGLIKRAKRCAVYSPLDGQPCADHDRQTGEGVLPQEWTLVKMRVLELRGKLAQLPGKLAQQQPDLARGDPAVFFLAATLRPETMYGQTNCWVLPEGLYNAYLGPGGAVYVMGDRAALNLSWQEGLPGPKGQPIVLLTGLSGQDLMGTPLQAPLAQHRRIYTLPLLTISMNKGTGIVTSVPSDSPDDYMALSDLKLKEKFRQKFSVEDDWVLPFEVVPVMEIEGYGNKAAEHMCKKLKIASQNDSRKLEEAKGEVYLRGFTKGIMCIGAYSGQKVSEVKSRIKDDMLAAGDAIKYWEPERPVTSRSGDSCVVALTDQWYLEYGEDAWRARTENALGQMNTYSEDCMGGFRHALGWLREWACSRSFGLGTRLPCDPEYLVESLSDSTIYMAYYTVAHLVQGGDMFSRDGRALSAADLTDEVWDHVFVGGAAPSSSRIPPETLQAMRREFCYWYPFDVRVSGKDLINNHLTFCLYNHTAIWHDDETKWPRGMRCNGHLMLDAMKMSKSTGNFKTLRQAIEEYGADAMRLALADSGDSMEDANFDTSAANAAILRLYQEKEFARETIAAEASLRSGAADSFADRVFEADMNAAVHAAHEAYESMQFRDALKAGCFELQNGRDRYRLRCGAAGMHAGLARRYVEVAAKLLTPICPHTCDHIWRAILGQPGTILTAGWPEAEQPDTVLQSQAAYLDGLIESLRGRIAKEQQPRKGKQAPAAQVTGMTLHVAQRYEGWREAVLVKSKALWNSGCRALTGPEADELVVQVKLHETTLSSRSDKDIKKMVLPFAKKMWVDAARLGEAVLDVKLPFDEAQLLQENQEFLLRTLGGHLEHLDIVQANGAQGGQEAQPGDPAVMFDCRQ